MSSELALIPSESEFSVMERQADALVKSGFLPQSVNTAQKAIAIMMMGRELNIPTWQAINGISVIQGKPTVSPQLMIAMIERSGKLEDMSVSGDEKSYTCTMKRVGRSSHTETFTFQDAGKMNLTNKQNWKNMPAVMLKWRAISACARVVFPDVIMGLYTTEEINPDVTIDEHGEAQQSNIVQMPRQPEQIIEGEVSEDDDKMTTDEAKKLLGQNGQHRVSENTVKWFNKSEDVEKFGKWLAEKKDGLPCIGYFEALSGKTISEYAGGKEACTYYLDNIDPESDKVNAGNHALYQKIASSEYNPFNAYPHFEHWMNKHGFKLDIQPTWQLSHLIENILKVKKAVDAEKPENGGGKDDAPERPTTNPIEDAKAKQDQLLDAPEKQTAGQYDEVKF